MSWISVRGLIDPPPLRRPYRLVLIRAPLARSAPTDRCTLGSLERQPLLQPHHPRAGGDARCRIALSARIHAAQQRLFHGSVKNASLNTAKRVPPQRGPLRNGESRRGIATNLPGRGVRRAILGAPDGATADFRLDAVADQEASTATNPLRTLSRDAVLAEAHERLLVTGAALDPAFELVRVSSWGPVGQSRGGAQGGTAGGRCRPARIPARGSRRADAPRRSASLLTTRELPSGPRALQGILRGPRAPPNPPGGPIAIMSSVVHAAAATCSAPAPVGRVGVKDAFTDAKEHTRSVELTEGVPSHPVLGLQLGGGNGRS